MSAPAPKPASEPAADVRPRAGRRSRRALDAAAALLLAAACAGPAVGALLRPGVAAESVAAEQRKPALRPAVPRTPREAAKLPRALKAWHDDHLGFRDVLLEARSRLLLDGLGVSPTPSAVIGDDGWLWFAGESSFDAWRGAAPLRPHEIEAWVRVFRDRAAWCRSRGIAYVAALAPNKMEVYPERVPPPHAQVGPSRYEQITTALSAEPPGWFLDLGAELRDEKRHDTADDFVYSRRGTHWTARAALRGATAMLALARAAGAPVELPRRADFEFVPTPFDDDGWSGQLHLPDLAKEVQPVLGRNLTRPWRPTERLDAVPKRVETLTGAADLPRLWVVHDSFGAALRPMLAPYFARIVFDWRHLGEFDPTAMDELAPHVVIDLHTERQIFRPAPALTASRDEAERARRFERAGASVWSLADSADRASPDEGMSLAVEGGGLVLESTVPGAGVVFQDAELAVRGTAILRLVVESEHAGKLYVQCQSRGRSGWRTAPSTACELGSGERVLDLEFVDTRARGPIRLVLGPGLGTLRLRAAEIRSAGW